MSTPRTFEDFSQDTPPADWDGTHYQVHMPHLAVNAEEGKVRKAAILTADDGSPAHTYNWDTVFAIKFSDVNAGLAKPNVTPTDFSQTQSETGANCTGKFGGWTLTGGGDTLLHMSVPITSGTVKYHDQKGNPTQQKMDGAVCVLEVHLQQLETTKPVPNHKSDSTTTGGQLKNFVVDHQAAISVMEVTGLPATYPFLAKLYVQGVMQEWFNANIADFTYAFSTVNLNAVADKGEYQWLQPTATGYAVVENDADPDESIFGILCMVGENPKVPSTQQVSPNAIPPDNKSGFLISGENFLGKLVLPGVYTLFDGAKASDFALSSDGTMITNVNKVKMNKVKGDDKDGGDGGTYQPTCDPNTVQISISGATEVKLELLKAVVEYSPGITIVMTYTMFSSLELGHNDKGAVIKYKKAGKPIVNHSVDVASWVTWSEVAASVAAAVITMGAGSAIKKAIETAVLRVIAILITLLVTETIANISLILQALATGDENKLPSIDLMTINATDPITWPDSGDFDVKYAALNSSFQMGGNPNFISG